MPKYRCPICGKIHEEQNIIRGKKKGKYWRYKGITVELPYSFICDKCYNEKVNDISEHKLKILDNIRKRARVRNVAENIFKYSILLVIIFYACHTLAMLLPICNISWIQNIGNCLSGVIINFWKWYQPNEIQYPFAWMFFNIFCMLSLVYCYFTSHKTTSKILFTIYLAYMITSHYDISFLNDTLKIVRWFLGFFALILIFGPGTSSVNCSDGYSNNEDTNWSTRLERCCNDSITYEKEQEQKRFRDIEENRREDQERQRQVNEATYQRQREFKENQRQKNETIMVAYQSGSVVEVRNMNSHLMFRRSGNLSGYTSSTVTIYKDCGGRKLYTVYNNKGIQIRQFSSN